MFTFVVIIVFIVIVIIVIFLSIFHFLVGITTFAICVFNSSAIFVADESGNSRF